jgi:hypothetical protein
MNDEEVRAARREGRLTEALITPAADANGWVLRLDSSSGGQVPYTGHTGTEHVYHDLDRATQVAKDLGFDRIRVEERF